MPAWEKELAVALDAVHRASTVTAAIQHHLSIGQRLTKSDDSPVTVADFAAQAVVCSLLREALPECVIVAEESATELRKPEASGLRRVIHAHVHTALERNITEEQVLDLIDLGASDVPESRTFWTLDPIDGTKGFLRGDQYCVALALIHEGKVVLGVMGCPRLPVNSNATLLPIESERSEEDEGLLMAAVIGQGTRVWSLTDTAIPSGRLVRVSDTPAGPAAKFCGPVESEHADHGRSDQVARALGITSESVRLDSQAKYAVVARGQAEIYMRLPQKVDRREYVWDHAAGAIVVTEAGGIVSDVRGKPLDFSVGKRLENNWGILATNTPIHDATVRALGRVV
jgi:3'(2'), 5'-bisphosphate nucleotidase